MTTLSSWSSAVGLPALPAGAAVHSEFVYRFQGSPFDSVGDAPLAPGTFKAGESITGWFSTAALLQQNLHARSDGKDISAVILDWNFDNGRGVLKHFPTAFFDLAVSTDASGNITEWTAAGTERLYYAIPIGSSNLAFSLQYHVDDGEGIPWGQTQSDFTYIFDSRHAFADGAVSSNKPGSWLTPVEITSGTKHSETIVGTDLSSVLNGFAGNDRISGAGGNDEIYGGAGSDKIFGGAGVDRLLGGSGNDTVDGGAGNDFLTGGIGSDVFIFTRGAGVDRITDFQLGIDKIAIASGAAHLSDLHFKNVAVGVQVHFADVTFTVLHHTAAEMNVIDSFIF